MQMMQRLYMLFRLSCQSCRGGGGGTSVHCFLYLKQKENEKQKPQSASTNISAHTTDMCAAESPGQGDEGCGGNVPREKF